MTPVLVGAAALAATSGALYALYRWRQGQLAAQDGATPLPDAEQTPTPAPSQPASPAPTSASGQAPMAKPGNSDPNYWGTTTRGEVYRPLLTKIEAVTGMPLRLYLCVVANREGAWVHSARNKTKKGEVKASTDAIANGAKRGNPSPKYAASIAAAGSGGLFGALARTSPGPGSDKDFTPYLKDSPRSSRTRSSRRSARRSITSASLAVAAIRCSPTPRSRPPEDNYRVRLGWANPSVLKDNPGGELFQDVKKRFDEDLAQLGLKISDLAPPNADRWPASRRSSPP